MMMLLRKCLALIMILCAISLFILGMLWVSHELKPTADDYRGTIASSGAIKQIYLVNNGWHTDIVLRMEDVSTFVLPEKRYFPGRKYLVIGWGDAGFYQAKHITMELAARALLKPSETVVHMAGMDAAPTASYPASHVVALQVSKRGFDRMMSVVAGSVKRYSTLSAQPLRKGLTTHSQFFVGKGRYHAFNNCNHWTARMLKAADVPFNVVSAFTARNVMWQASRYAKDGEDSKLDATMSIVQEKLNAFVEQYAE